MPLPDREMLICDLTQSWSERGGGIGTYLRRKREHILARTPHRHLLIVPGERDEIEEQGRTITARIASPTVPRNPNYRLLLRNAAVKKVLDLQRPDIIECQDSYNLPWAALSWRRQNPETLLVGGYCTDFPTAYVRRFGARWVGETLAGAVQEMAYAYCGSLYRRFDAVYALSEQGGAPRLRQEARRRVSILPLGIDLDLFTPRRRDPALRAAWGARPDQPVLIYAGRLDAEKKCVTVFDAFRRLPPELGAVLVMLGEGRLRDALIEASRGLRAHFPGFIGDPAETAACLASGDIYVSGMADETFGLSVIEAQAAGLPVVGIAGGAMLERVPDGLGYLGPVDDVEAMASNILRCWNGDRRAMGEKARTHVAERFSWRHTFEILFDQIYPRAAARRAIAMRARPRMIEQPKAAAAGDP